MIKIPKPKPANRAYTQTVSPQAGQTSAIMDDTVFIMDDSSTLMGGQVILSSNIRAKAGIPRGIGIIKIRR